MTRLLVLGLDQDDALACAITAGVELDGCLPNHRRDRRLT